LKLEFVFHGGQGGALPNDLFRTPDNICASPYGGLLMCQDFPNENYLMGLTPKGQPYLFAYNRVEGELAGVTFSADGRTMYLNCYEPGRTFAIHGDWDRLRAA
jgi:secreted PhoX family phosphatase